MYRARKKELKRRLAKDMLDMERRLLELRERFEDNGLDGIFADYNGQGKKLTGAVFNAES